MAFNLLKVVASDERGEIRLFNVARLRGVLRPARSENMEWPMPIARALLDRTELSAHRPGVQFLGLLAPRFLGFLGGPLSGDARFNCRISELAKAHKRWRLARA
jgi:hypothetical protein